MLVWLRASDFLSFVLFFPILSICSTLSILLVLAGETPGEQARPSVAKGFLLRPRNCGLPPSPFGATADMTADMMGGRLLVLHY